MTTAQDHYDHLLAQHYTWMFGASFADKVAEQTALLQQAGVTATGVVVDLGCGPGFQSVALAHMGATEVHAVDTSGDLLRELTTYIEDQDPPSPITLHQADLTTFSTRVTGPADTIICMGDTLTHLTSLDAVAGLFKSIAVALSPGGRVVLSWRDMSTPATGLDRFIPLHSDDERIMTCFLEDCGDTVQVHDLVHVRTDDGWQLTKSAYPKLKLSVAWVVSALGAAGLQATYQSDARGMTLLAADLSSAA